ncbi:MAG TPA: transketolase C-terminal domain-containing protein, partial [Thermoleophilaceae bacterium]
HGSPLGDEEVKLTKQAYGWPADRDFYVPDGVLEHFGAVAERGRAAEQDWEARAARYREAHPDLWAQLELVMDGRLPEGWDADVPSFAPGDGPVATRKASGQVIQWAAEQVPQLTAGSADLDPSTLTVIDGGGDVQKGNWGARNVHYGVREHAMGAIVNGLNLHGLRAYGATFFNFLDYMKASVRLAALMHLPSVFVYTHDSIGLGEDGPTHQPVEQLAILRAQPNICAVRPADANETARAWQFALNRGEGPTALVLSRQGLPILDPDAVPADAVERGAYVLRPGSKADDPDVILIGTGSEVSVCLGAAELLEADGVATRVVSAPCLDQFAEQEVAYRDTVLPPACRARVSVEAASPLGWSTWTGTDGDEVAMTSFGASAPQPDLYEHFGFTPEKVAKRAQAVVKRLGNSSGGEGA